MLGSVLDKLDAYLGRQFLLGRYIPCLLFATINALVACFAFPSVRAFFRAEYAGFASDKAIDLVLALLGVAILAYAASPIMPAWTRLLEGRWPGWAEWLLKPRVRDNARRRDDLDRRLGQAKDRTELLPDPVAVIESLKVARASGENLRAITDAAAIEAARDALAELRALRELNKPIEPGVLTGAIVRLSQALSRNCAEMSQLRPETVREDALRSARLARYYHEMYSVFLPYAIDIAALKERAIEAERARAFASAELAATRLGNDAAVLRAYCADRYRCEFDFLWPRLLLVIQRDKEMSDGIVAAKTGVDFWVLCHGLLWLSAAGWIVLLCASHTSQPIALLSGLYAVPLLAYGVLRLVHASFALFAETMRSAIDMKRLDVIEALQFQRPGTPEEERMVWEGLVRWLVLNDPPPVRPFLRGKTAANV